MKTSKTKIELKFPYKEDWKFGYVVVNPEGRRTLLLYNSHSDRTSTQYARYLLSVSLGRYLTKDETVDHIDGDKANDSLDNLQILSLYDNVRKTRKMPDIELVCPICGTVFYRSRTQLRGKLDRAKEGKITCSRVCGRKMSSITMRRNMAKG